MDEVLDLPLPGADLDVSKMPGHWLLARLGKKVLRPGGRELTETMLRALSLGPEDDVLEFAPGMGETARLVFAHQPGKYIGVERDHEALALLQRSLGGVGRTFRQGNAADTGLPDESVSACLGEAFLTMNPDPARKRIVAEAYRLLRPGGRLALHELTIEPDGASEALKSAIRDDLTQSIRVGARPLTRREWRQLLQAAGFVVEYEFMRPMHLLKTSRLVADEGVLNTLRIAANALRDPDALKRVLHMRATFQKHMRSIGAVALVARKPG